jgi:hypothetical protein
MIAPPTKLFSPNIVWHVLTTPLAPIPTHTFLEKADPKDVLPSEYA